jgi:DNA-binding SARP family transcriptional activator
MSRLALYLLGPPRLELDGEPVEIGRRRAVALLAYLAVTGAAPQP